MKFLQRIKDQAVYWRYNRINRYLHRVSAAKLAVSSERKALKAFHRAARASPAYRAILRRHDVDPAGITSIEHFKRLVPIIDKQTLFAECELRNLCVNGDLDDISLFYSSSGHSNVFSFGVETRSDAKAAARAMEFSLHNAFNALNKRTMVINCLPMGVKIHTRTLPLAETSVRADVVRALLRKLKDDFEQFILVGEHLFLKQLIENDNEHDVPWKDLVVHIVTGGEYIPENFRTYLAKLLGIDFENPEKGLIGVNFGLSELSMSIFSENAHTLRIRRLACENHDFRKALYGCDTSICPNIMQYYPQLTYIETIPNSSGRNELVVTMLDPARKLPVIRYNTGDIVETMTHADLAQILGDFGHQTLLPPLALPIGMTWGKSKPMETKSGQHIYPEQVKEALYADTDIAAALTGNFRLVKETNEVKLLLQLRENAEPPKEPAANLAIHLAKYLQADIPTIQLFTFRDFPYGFEQDFERKNRYL